MTNHRNRACRFLALGLMAVVASASTTIKVGAGSEGADDHRATATVTREVRAQTEPVNAPGQNLILAKIVVPPGATLAPHFHEGAQVARLVAGTLTYHLLSGHADLTTAAGVTSRPTAPATILLRPGDVLIENPALVHYAENRGRNYVVIELSSLLRKGAAPSTPVGGTTQATHITVGLTSTGTQLHTVDSSVLYGWNHLIGTGLAQDPAGGAPSSVDVDMQAGVSYVGGQGVFEGFATFTFADGATLAAKFVGEATIGGGATNFNATMVVLGGIGRFSGAHGSGTFTGSRTAAIGSPVALEIDLYPTAATP